MTGTAATEAAEFSNIYKLEVTEVPTNKSLSRTDNPDVVFRSEAGAYLTHHERGKIMKAPNLT